MQTTADEIAIQILDLERANGHHKIREKGKFMFDLGGSGYDIIWYYSFLNFLLGSSGDSN